MSVSMGIVLAVAGLLVGAAAAWLWLRGRDQALQAVLRERDGQPVDAVGAI